MEGGLLPLGAAGKSVSLTLDELPQSLREQSQSLFSEAALTRLQGKQPQPGAADTQTYNIRLERDNSSSEHLLKQQICPDEMLDLIDDLFAYADERDAAEIPKETPNQ
jgi:hypothetical protein